MTEAQQAILEQVENLLIEHFDAYVLAVNVADIDDTGDHASAGSWNGGRAMAIGLCEMQKARLISEHLADNAL